MFQLKKALYVKIDFFFEGYSDDAPVKDGFDELNIDSKETVKVLKAYYNIKDDAVRKKMLDMITTISGVEK